MMKILLINSKTKEINLNPRTLTVLNFVFFISGTMHAMQPANQNMIKITCDISNAVHDHARLSFIHFKASLHKDRGGSYPIQRAAALQSNITRTPAITIDPQAQTINISCAFKAAGARDAININETVHFDNPHYQRHLSENWRITIKTIMPSQSDVCER